MRSTLLPLHHACHWRGGHRAAHAAFVHARVRGGLLGVESDGSGLTFDAPQDLHVGTRPLASAVATVRAVGLVCCVRTAICAPRRLGIGALPVRANALLGVRAGRGAGGAGVFALRLRHWHVGQARVARLRPHPSRRRHGAAAAASQSAAARAAAAAHPSRPRLQEFPHTAITGIAMALNLAPVTAVIYLSLYRSSQRAALPVHQAYIPASTKAVMLTLGLLRARRWARLQSVLLYLFSLGLLFIYTLFLLFFSEEQQQRAAASGADDDGELFSGPLGSLGQEPPGECFGRSPPIPLNPGLSPRPACLPCLSRASPVLSPVPLPCLSRASCPPPCLSRASPVPLPCLPRKPSSLSPNRRRRRARAASLGCTRR